MKAPAQLRWQGEGLVFEGGPPGGRQTRVDGDGKVATSPVALLLVSLAGCTAADVVDIAKKMRLPLEEVELDVDADRADEHPRRLVKVHLAYRIVGGAEEDTPKLQRAIDLSHEKYCSVLHSLATDIEVTSSLTHVPATTDVQT